MSDPHPAGTRSYGPHPSSCYDVYLPPAATPGPRVVEPGAAPDAAGRAPAPVTVALVHGGFWKAAYDRDHLRPLAAALAADGCHVALVEYARVGMPGGGWPGTGYDVVDAVHAVAADPQLPGPIVVVGHSAGGHLALWAAGSVHADDDGDRPRPVRPGESHRVVGVVTLAGVADLGLAARLNLGADAVTGLLGPSGLATRPQPDPALLASAPGVWVALLHGDQDEDVPVQVSASYLDTRAAGDACRLVVVPGAGHFDLIDPRHPAYRTLLAVVRQPAPPP